MKKLFRQIIGFSFGIPYVLIVKYLALFSGKEKAVQLAGEHITRMAKGSLKYWVPKTDNASEFDLFRSKMKANIRMWSFIFDVSVEKDDQDTFKITVSNCPFCEAFMKMGMPELAPYVCQGDWEKAKDNEDRWEFEREHQIGTGHSFCDHTYKRKKIL
ncbi:MAG: L-2-amino-thiazoline-4-carboxylic acid hydrolase [Desulfobacteraceae bacterium]|nr:L-2-amino-thiazoline-4-carboxylic acid hydrolase [Desulfobacteraceae bacterium]